MPRAKAVEWCALHCDLLGVYGRLGQDFGIRLSRAGTAPPQFSTVESLYIGLVPILRRIDATGALFVFPAESCSVEIALGRPGRMPITATCDLKAGHVQRASLVAGPSAR
jgi:hypothetical protein